MLTLATKQLLDALERALREQPARLEDALRALCWASQGEDPAVVASWLDTRGGDAGT